MVENCFLEKKVFFLCIWVMISSSILLCIVEVEVGGRSMAVAVDVSDIGQATPDWCYLRCDSFFSSSLSFLFTLLLSAHVRRFRCLLIEANF